MKPDLALDLSHDGLRLFHRAAPDWRLVGEARFDDPALAEQIAGLRATALALCPAGIATKLILPDSEILYLEMEAPATDPAGRRRQIRAGLAGRTPHAVEDLAFDWSGEGPVVQVAVIARATLEEAEAFAADHRFAPLSFVAAPDAGRFRGEPFFGQSRIAAAILPPGERVERDPLPARPPAPADASPSAPEAAGLPPAAEDAPLPAAPPEDIAKDAGPAENGFLEADLVESGAAENGRAETGPTETGLVESGAVETGLAEIGLAETRAAETRLAETDLVETDLGETGTLEAALAAAPAPSPPARQEAPAPLSGEAEEAQQAGPLRLPEVEFPARAVAQADPAPAKADPPFPAEVAAVPLPEPATSRTEDPEPAASEPPRALAEISPATPALTVEPKAKRHLPRPGIPSFGRAARGGPGAETPARAPREPRPHHLSLRLTGGLVAALILVWLLAGLLPDRLSAELDPDTAGATELVAAGSALSGSGMPESPAHAMTSPAALPEGKSATAGLPAQEAAAIAPAGEALRLASNEATPTGMVSAMPSGKVSAMPTGTASDLSRDAPATAPPSATNRDAAIDRAARPAALLLASAEPAPAATSMDQLRDALSAAPVFTAVPEEALALVETPPAARPGSAALAPVREPALAASRPRARPGSSAPPAAVVPSQLAATTLPPGDRPRARPGSAPASAAASPPETGSAATDTAAPSGPAAVAETGDPAAKLPARRASARPDRVVRAAEAENPPVAVAMARPRSRPRDFSAGVNSALAAAVAEPVRTAPAAAPAAPIQTAAVAPTMVRPAAQAAPAAPVATPNAARAGARQASPLAIAPEAEDELESAPVMPAIPTRASVARQATLEDAMNLRKVNLIGVYGTANNRRALVRLPNGRMQQVRVGDRLDGGQVAAITDREIRYVKSGRSLVLSLPNG